MDPMLPVIDREPRHFNPCHGKACYPTKKAAITAMRGAMNRRKNRPKMLRHYWCPACECHHLTSKELRE